MIARDWRDLPAEAIAPLYDAETRRWRDTLDWDTAGSWRAVEAGRQAGHAVGVVATDDGARVRGWCFGALRAGTLHIGGCVAHAPSATATLLAGLAETPESRRATRWHWFGWCAAPGLDEALAQAGATVTDYRYMRCARPATPGGIDTPGPARDAAPRPWCAADAARLPAVLASAYAEPDVTRPFAPSGLLADWYEYAGHLLAADGCGVFDEDLSLAIAGPRGEALGLAVVTRLSADTAHLAQLAVRADAHGQGLGRALLEAVLDRAWRAGRAAMTLLVSRRNLPATRLYERAGFADVTTFLSALQAPVPGSVQPRTLRKDALATGGASTRR